MSARICSFDHPESCPRGGRYRVFFDPPRWVKSSDKKLKVMKNHWASDILRRTSKADISVLSDLQNDIKRLCEIVQGLPYYEFRNPKLAELADTLSYCDDIKSLAEVMVEVGDTCGFDHANIFVLRHGDAVAFNKRVCTSFPEAWLRLYDVKKYQFLDPVVARAMKGGEPFLFSDLPDDAPMVKTFWAAAVAHGIGCEGCCFVFDLDLDIRIGMSFACKSTQELATASFETNRSDLQVLGEIACSVFVELAGMIRVDKTQLSVDELRYLKDLISTTNQSGASEILQDPDMQIVQRSICKRLGVGTIFQALAVVARERWFDDLPFDSREIVQSYPNQRRDSHGLSADQTRKP